jgi:hypothetical protein
MQSILKAGTAESIQKEIFILLCDYLYKSKEQLKHVVLLEA